MEHRMPFSCKHEGCSVSKHTAKGYCAKHYTQFKRKGRTFAVTQKDPNEVLDKGNHYELILTGLDMEETGRAKIDKEDLHLVQSVGRWYLTNGYVFNRHSKTLMHRLIMKVDDTFDVDHKRTGFKYRSDNRKSNIRVCTQTQNNLNINMHKDNTSGYKGVVKSGDKWKARICVKGKITNLGTFINIEDAARAYKKAAKQMHKDFLHSSLRSKQSPQGP
jgi:hypothetical protein